VRLQTVIAIVGHVKIDCKIILVRGGDAGIEVARVRLIRIESKSTPVRFERSAAAVLYQAATQMLIPGLRGVLRQ
jgi:hypothetical protein